jgi:hypothetical protein
MCNQPSSAATPRCGSGFDDDDIAIAAMHSCQRSPARRAVGPLAGATATRWLIADPAQRAVIEATAPLACPVLWPDPPAVTEGPAPDTQPPLSPPPSPDDDLALAKELPLASTRHWPSL